MKKALIVFAMIVFAGPVFAQGMGLNNLKGKIPVTIEADNGLEWLRDENVYIARGNALATRGNFSVQADELKAFYKGKTDDSEINRIEAIGHVHIKTEDHDGYAEYGEYNVPEGTLHLTGKNLRLVTDTDTVTAEDYIEYREFDKKAIAVGNATVTREKNKLKSDLLTANFVENAAGDMEVSTVKADGNVVITTPEEKVVGRQGVYTLKTGLAVLTGGVVITRQDNVLRGEVAEVNLKTGVSRLLTGNKGRVRGVFSPQKGS